MKRKKIIEVDMKFPMPTGLVRTCKKCGCTDHDCRQCIAKTGQPCYWISENLCSACAPHLKSQTAYLVNVHHYGFRPGEPAKILGVEMVQPDNVTLPVRACYKINYGTATKPLIDYVPVVDHLNFRILSYKDRFKYKPVRNNKPLTKK